MPDERRAGAASARSMTLQTFCAMTSPIEPPKTVKSWRRDEDPAAVDRAVAGDDAVAGRALAVHPEVVRAVHRERVGLDERALVHQQVEPLAGGELAAVVLLLRRVAAAGREGGLLLACGAPRCGLRR